MTGPRRPWSGQPLPRLEDRRLLTEGARYVADTADPRLDGAWYAVFVRSTIAHGHLAAIDVEDAVAVPGVEAVLTAGDLDGLPPVPPMFPVIPDAMAQPFLADGCVRYVGEPVAVVVATTLAAAIDAAELVVVDYDALPPVLDPRAAATDDVLLYPAFETNTVCTYAVGDEGDIFEDCAVVTTVQVDVPRLAACPLEGRSVASVWVEGELHHWVSVQTPHMVRASVARWLGLDPAVVHIHVPDVGGGFGAKAGSYPEDVLVAWLARRLEHPVRWTEFRRENMVGLAHGRGQQQRVTIGADETGRVSSLHVELLQDAGAYPMMGAYIPTSTMRMTGGPYLVPRIAATARVVATTTTPVTAYRGAGRPEATLAVEQAMDALARRLCLDPVEVRRRNLLPPDAFPYRTPLGLEYDSGDYVRGLDLVLEAAGYDDLRAEQRRRRRAGDRRELGIGVATYVESTAGPRPGEEYARVEVDQDGAFTVLCGTMPHGQGHVTSWTMLVADALGVALDRIAVVHGDTDRIPIGGGTYGSRSLQVGGPAVTGAAQALVERARSVAAELLEADPADMVFDVNAGQFHVAGTPTRGVTWDQVAAASGGLSAELRFEGVAPTYPFGTHLAVVEVDVDTGDTRLVRLVALDDCGTVLNPLVADGQRHGGIAQGASEVLYEAFVYDADGNPLTSSFAEYCFPSAADLPSFELVAMETPTPHNELGAKGIGESGTTGSLAAVLSAVGDALSPYGVEHIDPPITPERVWRALTVTAR